jgi:hypothetical protein
VWFQGHWGFQYYLELAGGRAMDVRRVEAAPGDVVALPLDNTRVVGVPEHVVGSRERFELATAPWGSTMQRATAAGFYASSFGPLPYRFGRTPPQRFELVTLAAPGTEPYGQAPARSLPSDARPQLAPHAFRPRTR